MSNILINQKMTMCWFFVLGYYVGLLVCEATAISTGHYECAIGGSRVIQAFRGGRINGSDVIVDFRGYDNVAQGNRTCKVTARKPGYLYISVLTFPFLDCCGTQVTIEQDTLVTHKCTRIDMAPLMLLIDEFSEVQMTLTFLSKPYSSNYCYQLYGSVDLIVECSIDDAEVLSKSYFHSSFDILYVTVVLIISAVLTAMIVRSQKKKASEEKQQLFFISFKDSQNVNSRVDLIVECSTDDTEVLSKTYFHSSFDILYVTVALIVSAVLTAMIVRSQKKKASEEKQQLFFISFNDSQNVNNSSKD